jgi:hypothetical protein
MVQLRTIAGISLATIMLLYLALLITDTVYLVRGKEELESLKRLAAMLEACPSQENASCYDGNACNLPLLTPVCPQEEFRRRHGWDDHQRDHHDDRWGSGWRGPWDRSSGGDDYRYTRPPRPTPAPGGGALKPCESFVCSNPPLPSGACCNRNDFCYLPDPTKYCFNGQCISNNQTLCRGFCEVDTDCTVNSSAPIPIYPTAEPSFFCFHGACLGFVDSLSTVIVPTDLLNLTTQLAVNTSACLESSCTMFEGGEGAFTICQYAFRCSQLSGFSGGSVKRGLEETLTAPLFNFTLPGGNARYTRAQYLQLNAELNVLLQPMLSQSK